MFLDYKWLKEQTASKIVTIWIADIQNLDYLVSGIQLARTYKYQINLSGIQIYFILSTWNRTCFSHLNTWQECYSDSHFILLKGISKNQFVGSCSQLNQLVPRLGKGFS